MLATTQTCAVIGLGGLVVQVEVDISPDLPAFIRVSTYHWDFANAASKLNL